MKLKKAQVTSVFMILSFNCANGIISVQLKNKLLR